jgi:hypothetical protein
VLAEAIVAFAMGDAATEVGRSMAKA